MREEMPNGRAGRPRGFVEVDDSLLGGDEQTERGDGLRDRGEVEGPARVAMRLDASREHDPGGCERHRPALDLAECLHAARY